jgi:hypothetical protein
MPFRPQQFLWLAKRAKAAPPDEPGLVDAEVFDEMRYEWALLSFGLEYLDRDARLHVTDFGADFGLADCGGASIQAWADYVIGRRRRAIAEVCRERAAGL